MVVTRVLVIWAITIYGWALSLIAPGEMLNVHRYSVELPVDLLNSRGNSVQVLFYRIDLV
jgi:hypothetical protein